MAAKGQIKYKEVVIIRFISVLDLMNISEEMVLISSMEAQPPVHMELMDYQTLIKFILVAVMTDTPAVLAKTLFMAVMMMIIFGAETEITNFMVIPVMTISMAGSIKIDFMEVPDEIISALKKAQIE